QLTHQRFSSSIANTLPHPFTCQEITMPDISTADFMQRVVAFLDRYEQNLPPVPPVIDWSQTPAARWVGQGDGGWLKPLEVTAGHGLGDLVGVDRQKALLEANTEQFVKGLPANNAL